MDNTIQVSDLTQGYGRTTVLRDINLTLTPGTILALIGPSGAGKTTLVATIMGMLKPRQGTVTVLNTAVPNRPLLARIGYMAQTDALYDSLTGAENLQFFGTMQGLRRAAMPERIKYAAGVVNLQPDLKKPVQDYSGGMKRRLSLAIALLADPAVLILDEPTVGIDPELRQQIWHELHALAASGKTILLTTHVMEDAEQADTIMMIRNGEAIAQGTPAQLTAQYHVATVEAAFLQAGRDQDAHRRND
ncbi:ABC transporter ATP-binding protein [Schleiferilactobacillus shenzhenensis]|uniref:NodI n=1 Tax=Schleiferilactobacillus shenzhenensis LY-73 TaxID=1231336 RepID=U4TRE0_9LACO|nr:ABC transporter ATP-binding protein [Schleiferilactobacillus shenzhenensis]ERL64072.1 NodI [Schleiferilactobacillus shenzhenensis LY-73]